MQSATPRLLRLRTVRLYSQQSSHPYLSRSNLNPSSSPSSSSSPHVGPFPLPSSSDDLDRSYRISQQARTWSQLKPPEKVFEATRQTSSFFVVVFGAGLAGLVFWAVGSELFSENSPTRIFEDITERLETDESLNSILLPPLSFHGSHSSDRLRRNRRIQHSLTTSPQTGLETLFIRFTVEGRDPEREKREREESWIEWGKRWIGPIVWEDSKHPEKYQASLTASEREAEEKREFEKREKEEGKGFWRNAFGGITNAFSLGGGSAASATTEGGGGLFKRLRKPKLGEYSTGEVVAELQKDPQTNQFVYKQLFVAFPDTSTPSYYRLDIPTDVVVPPPEGGEQQQGGLNRLRVWQRSRTVVQ
ncbi:uncharacterized protein JCM6883_005880 [Sporobolomyces salmoneus]|uniref:uncharacterized protein n=1 Tax=Sporobolomyces salmoneus TaxID=183962 RepID=UPI0031700FE6